jgi:hypothetical protein
MFIASLNVSKLLALDPNKPIESTIGINKFRKILLPSTSYRHQLSDLILVLPQLRDHFIL